MRPRLMGTFFGPCYGGRPFGAYEDGKSPLEINAVDTFYPHFLPGDIIIPKQRTNANYDLHHTFAVIGMKSNETSVLVRRITVADSYPDSVISSGYDLATEEEIAKAIRIRMTGEF